MEELDWNYEYSMKKSNIPRKQLRLAAVFENAWTDGPLPIPEYQYMWPARHRKPRRGVSRRLVP